MNIYSILFQLVNNVKEICLQRERLKQNSIYMQRSVGVRVHKLYKNQINLSLKKVVLVMSLNLRLLNQIDQRNKDLIFGFCKEHEKKYQHPSYPRLVHYSCLMFVIPTNDEFEHNEDLDSVIHVEPSEIIVRQIIGYKIMQYPEEEQIVQGINTAEHGVHRWRIQINEKGFGNSVGIVGTDNQYLFNLGGIKYNAEFGNKWTDIKCKNGDIFDLILDCTDWTLVFMINTGIGSYIKSIKVACNQTYKLGFSIFVWDECHFKLLKYNYTI